MEIERAFVSYSRVVHVIIARIFFLMFFSFPLQNGIFSSLTKNKKRERKKTKTKKTKGKKKKRSWFCRDTYVITGAMTTRETQQKSRMIGKRDSLWDLIVNNDDICFTHILPRLNSNGIKFLYEVNSETRKLIKRSSRKGEM